SIFNGRTRDRDALYQLNSLIKRLLNFRTVFYFPGPFSGFRIYLRGTANMSTTFKVPFYRNYILYVSCLVNYKLNENFSFHSYFFSSFRIFEIINNVLDKTLLKTSLCLI